jgi:hypothetical protein
VAWNGFEPALEMKHFALLLILFLAVLACKTVKEDLTTNPDLPPPFNGPGVSRERVLVIAAKYGLQDSIAVGYKSTTLKPPPPETYQYLSEEFFDGYFANWRKHLDFLEYEAQRQQKVANLQTVQEYFMYIESDPSLYRSEVETECGYDKYNAYKKDVFAGKYHIYICKHPKMGTYPTIVPADDDKPGAINGRLLRNEN